MMHKKHIWISIIVLLLGVVVFFFARPNSDKNERKVNLYFIDKSGYALTPVETEVSAKTNEELYKKVAEALIDGPEKKKYGPIMGSDVKLNNIEFFYGDLTLDFSEEYPEDDYLCTYAIIKTFSKLPGISRIQVTEDGKGIMGSDGAALGFISGEEISTEAGGDTTTGIRLYFANEAKDRLVMEYRKIKIVDTKPVEHYIVQELINGPTIDGYVRLLSADTKIISVETREGVCYVNLKKGFVENNVSSDKGKIIIDSVVKSLTELDNIDTVQFLEEGIKTDIYLEPNSVNQIETEVDETTVTE